MSNPIALPVNETPRTPAQPDRKPAAAPPPEPQLPVVSAAPQRDSAADISEAIETIRALVADMQRELQFSVDEDSGRTIITVIDSDSGRIIRQIPPEEVLQIARSVADGGRVNLIDSRV